MHEHIRKNKSEWKGPEISAKRVGKGFHRVFKAVENELKNSFPNLGASVSEVSHFTPEPSNFLEVTRLSSDVNKDWLKATLNDIKI